MRTTTAADRGPVTRGRDGRSAALARAGALYGRLLWVLPGGLRREYGDAMRQTFADLCAARADARGRGLAPVLAHAVADLAGGAAREWAVTLFARDRWHRATAAGICALAGLVVLYGPLRYPADLARIDDLAQDLLLLVVLASLAAGFAGSATVSPRTVGCAAATVPAWLIGTRFPSVALGYVAIVVAVAAAGGRAGTAPRAGLLAGAGAGVLAGATLLVLGVTTGILGMGGPVHDPDYHAGFLRADQSDPAAYVIGARTCGGAILMAGCAGLGLAVSSVRAGAARLVRLVLTGA